VFDAIGAGLAIAGSAVGGFVTLGVFAGPLASH
jgi:hypothetical protein